MITSFIWAQIASKHVVTSLDHQDRGRYLRTSVRRRDRVTESLIHAFWFVMISAGIAFFAFVPALLLDSGAAEAVELIKAQRNEELLHTLIGAFAVGIGIASFIWSVSGSGSNLQDFHERDERLR